MTALQKTFSNRHVVLPVVHVEGYEQARRNTLLARDAGADGVFFINHHTDWKELLSIFEQVKVEFPDFWMGVNCLGLYPEDVFDELECATREVHFLDIDVNGVWVDNAWIEENEEEQKIAKKIDTARCNFKGLYFGGVAFKYQRHVDDLIAAAKIAMKHMDVITTSGPGTGRAAELQKIATMKEAIGGFPLAIASGITPDNVVEYLPVADCFLVATGISRTFVDFDSSKMKQLIDVVRNF
jgi:hypothetical protein